ncbi:MAG: 6-phosphogluconolactonase [Candidatus Rokubacteria bacterium]|nr:6-phosphogluconolactonase [Candidatus Rokubacteria bacterium]
MALADVTVVATPAALAEQAAERFVDAATGALEQAGTFSVALSGGSAPRSLYARLAAEPFRSRVDWTRVRVFWGDERCVPPDHLDSNYRLAQELLLSKVPVRPDNVFRMQGEAADPDLAAAEYAGELQTAFGLKRGERPRFDLILLGMGADGHTASLFPHSTALREVTRLAVAVYVEAARGYRLTLTLPVLNAAAAVLFLATGSDKAKPLQTALSGKPSHTAPASLVRPERGTLHWIVDRPAATGLADALP